MGYCIHCGHENIDTAKFCTECGQDISSESALVPSTQPSETSYATSNQQPGTSNRIKKGCGLSCGAFIVLIIVLGVIGALIGSDDETDQETSSSSPAATVAPTAIARATLAPRPTAPPTLTPAPVIYEFQGTGDSVEGPFSLDAGLVSIALSHSGSRNFIVKVIGSDSEELSVNTIGSYSGGRAHGVSSDLLGLSPGSYRLQIGADGRWTAKVTQESPSAGQPPPVDIDGSGDDVVKWLLLREGQFVFSANHNGQRNFIVRLINASGSPDVLLVNKIGEYEGSQIIQVGGNSFGLNPAPGFYAVVIEADGNWGFNIEQ